MLPWWNVIKRKVNYHTLTLYEIRDNRFIERERERERGRERERERERERKKEECVCARAYMCVCAIDCALTFDPTSPISLGSEPVRYVNTSTTILLS